MDRSCQLQLRMNLGSALTWQHLLQCPCNTQLDVGRVLTTGMSGNLRKFCSQLRRVGIPGMPGSWAALSTLQPRSSHLHFRSTQECCAVHACNVLFICNLIAAENGRNCRKRAKQSQGQSKANMLSMLSCQQPQYASMQQRRY